MHRFPVDLTSRALVDPAQYGSAEEFRAARAATWAVLIEGGATMTEIGDAVGLSRERVRQILRKEGYDSRRGMRGSASHGNPSIVVAALRDPYCYSLRSLSIIAKYPADAAKMMLEELGLWPAAERLWRMRERLSERRGEDKARGFIISGIRSFAEQHGRPPGVNDAIGGLLPFAHTTVVNHFGTWNTAIAAAGFEPAPPGGRGHRRRRGAG